jgi:hypothetical protein
MSSSPVIAGSRSKPVWRDGLTQPLHYLIVAVKNLADSYNCVAVGTCGKDRFKVKFYPNLAAWNLTETQLSDDFGCYNFLDRSGGKGYVRCLVNTNDLEKLFARLATARNVAAVSFEQAMHVIQTGEGKDDSPAVHKRGSGIPSMSA